MRYSAAPEVRYFIHILFLITIGCQNARSPVGVYLSSDSDHFIQTTFEFRKDSILKVTSWSDMSGEIKETGKWYIKGDTIFTPNELEPNQVLEYFTKNDEREPFPVIKLYDKADSTGINLAKISINEREKPLELIRSGVYSVDIDPSQIEVINIKYLTQEYNFTISDQSQPFNVITFFWDFNKTKNDILYSQSWRMKGKKLIPLERGYSVLIKK